MGTRCMIGKRTKTGSVSAVFCHYDGYPEGVGAELLTNYDASEKVDALLAGGPMSSLGPTPEETDYYNGEDGVETYASIDEYLRVCSKKLGDGEDWSDVEYVYLWFNGLWLFAKTNVFNRKPPSLWGTVAQEISRYECEDAE